MRRKLADNILDFTNAVTVAITLAAETEVVVFSARVFLSVAVAIEGAAVVVATGAAAVARSVVGWLPGSTMVVAAVEPVDVVAGAVCVEAAIVEAAGAVVVSSTLSAVVVSATGAVVPLVAVTTEAAVVVVGAGVSCPVVTT